MVGCGDYHQLATRLSMSSLRACLFVKHVHSPAQLRRRVIARLRLRFPRIYLQENSDYEK